MAVSTTPVRDFVRRTAGVAAGQQRRGMNALLILNHSAGSMNGDKGALGPDALVEAFRAAGINVRPIVVQGPTLCAAVQDGIAQRPDVIFAGGGDGSISAAAGCLVDSGIPLGVLPLGTLNHFARDLGLPENWNDAVQAIARGAVREVDVAEVNGRVFINNCSIGSYAEAVRKRDALRRAHGAGKWWAMTLATLAVFRRLRRLRVHVDIEGRSFALRAPFIVVSNNRYSGRVLDYSLRPRLDEGRLCIYTTRAARRLTLLRLAWQSLLRNIDRVDGLEIHDFAAGTLHHDYGRLPIALDGELTTMTAPLQFRIRRRALRVISPAPAANHDDGHIAPNATGAPPLALTKR